MEIHGGSKNQNTLCHVQSENMDAVSMDRTVYVVLQHILLFCSPLTPSEKEWKMSGF